MELELIPLIGLARYKENNDFLNRFQNRREGNFFPETPLGYERTKLIRISSGSRKIPAIQISTRYWIFDEEKHYTKDGFTKLTMGMIIIVSQTKI